MGVELLPDFIRENYEVHEWKHACAILKNDFPAEWQDVVEVLTTFRWFRSWVAVGGGGGGCPLLVFGIRKSLYVED